MLDRPMLSEFDIWPDEIAKVKERGLAKLIVEYIASNYDKYVSGGEFDRIHIKEAEMSKLIKDEVSAINKNRKKDENKKLNVVVLSEISSKLVSSPFFSQITENLKLLK